MTLLIDIGNSNTEIARLDPQYGIQPMVIFRTDTLTEEWVHSQFSYDTQMVIASVVPLKNKLFSKYPNAIFVDYQNIPLIQLNLTHPNQVGADRLVTALAAYSQIQNSCLVIDSGTATTFCYIDTHGVYQGGAIVPGFEISSKALSDYTAQIPLIWVEPTDHLFGKNTREAVQVGLFRGTIHKINGFISDYRQLDPKITVMGTGTTLTILQQYIHFDLYDPQLILKGLAICAHHLL